MVDQLCLILEGTLLTVVDSVSAGTGGQFQFPSSFPATPLVVNNFANTTPVGVSVRGVRSIWQSTKIISNFSRCTLINRLPETSIVRKIYKWKTSTSSSMGRLKSQWEDDVRNDLRKMKLIKWTEQEQGHLKWKGIVEKVKTLPEL